MREHRIGVRQRRARLIGPQSRHLILEPVTQIGDLPLVAVALDFEFAQFAAHFDHFLEHVFDSHLELLFAATRREGCRQQQQQQHR